MRTLRCVNSTPFGNPNKAKKVDQIDEKMAEIDHKRSLPVVPDEHNTNATAVDISNGLHWKSSILLNGFLATNSLNVMANLFFGLILSTAITF